MQIAGSNEATRLAAPSVKQEPLIWDYDFRVALIDQLASLARFIEEACDGEPQDIEGCVDGDGVITVVQIRPQN